MARLSGSYNLHHYTICLVLAMLMWCCPTTQVAVPREREPSDVAALADGVRSDGHSGLVSSLGASIKRSSTVAERYEDRKTRSITGHSENDLPTRNYTVVDVKRPEDGDATATDVQLPSVNNHNPRDFSERRVDDGGLREGAADPQRKGESRGGLGVEQSQDRMEEESTSDVEVVTVGSGNSRFLPEEKGSGDKPKHDGEGRDGNHMEPHPTSCDRCQKSRREELLHEYDPNALMQLRIETIKRQILDKLRMERPPQVNVSSINIPAPLSEGTFMGEEEEQEKVQDAIRHLGPDEVYDTSEDYYGKTTRVIVPAKADAPPCPVISMASTCFEFDISSVVRSTVAMAELWLYWTGDEMTTRNHTLIIGQPSGRRGQTSRTIAIHNVPPSQPAGWITVDIKHAVRRWRSHSHHDQIVQVSCPTSNAILPLAVESGYKPLIVIRVADDEKSRRRRNVNCDANTTDCCRQHFHLRFRDLGWDWVISPRGFDANYCRGSCANFNSPSLTHTSIMQTLRFNAPNVNIPRPCCSPRTTGSLSMIYIDDNGKFYTVDLPQVKILSCGCS